MKKFLLLFLLLLVIFTNRQSTTYFPFPERDAVWNFNFSLLCMFGNGNENYSITFDGDTLINHQNYHKLITPFVESFSSGNCEKISTGYKGAIRQDIAAKKVFFVPRTETTEQLLYDFTLQIGDTVKGYIQANLSQKDTIENIDSVLVGNAYRKRWLINSRYNICIIEGIGSTYGLVEQSPGNKTDFPNFSINCFRENNQTLLPNLHASCGLISYVKPIDINSNQIQIKSNSERSSFTIEFLNSDILEIKLINMYGMVITQQLTKNKKSIIVDNVQDGIYLLIGKDINNRKIIKKLICCHKTG